MSFAAPTFETHGIRRFSPKGLISSALMALVMAAHMASLLACICSITIAFLGRCHGTGISWTQAPALQFQRFLISLYVAPLRCYLRDFNPAALFLAYRAFLWSLVGSLCGPLTPTFSIPTFYFSCRTSTRWLMPSSTTIWSVAKPPGTIVEADSQGLDGDAPWNNFLVLPVHERSLQPSSLLKGIFLFTLLRIQLMWSCPFLRYFQAIFPIISVKST